MKCLDLTFPAPAENLACDEWLLNCCEEGSADEVLRFWEPEACFVVVGYANRVQREVEVDRCRAGNIPILRRCSGGGTVLQGPGCLNYSLILKITEPGPTSSITRTNSHVMERHRRAMQALMGTDVAIQGCTDLALGNRKFSGNAQRRKRNALIFHGTFLLNFDLQRIETLLRIPSRQPDYRGDRRHTEFLINLDIDAGRIKESLKRIWDAGEPFRGVPDISPLARERYESPGWNFKF